uniref:Rho-GAP domain-containing protein n=1 Tax=Romanomermis culicivorax TaxID=13658 RepID=A0A915HT05_ROMCU
CRISCHKKCCQKLSQPCGKSLPGDNVYVGRGRVFGADLTSLIDKESNIPRVLEKLLIYIEYHFLRFIWFFTVLKYKENFDTLNFDDIPHHLMASLIKSFFRELNEPLLTFDLYENFLSVADIFSTEVEDQKERLRCIYAMIELLPKANRNVFDPLMYHLARVAHHLEVNRMSSQNLAVIFTLCVLKRPNAVKAQEQLEDVAKQTLYVGIVYGLY